MGSFKHPKIYDPATVETIRDSFHDIMEELDEKLVFSISEQRLKATIIEQLLTLATDGTPPDEWKSKILSGLALR